jgi:hypothetical protein
MFDLFLRSAQQSKFPIFPETLTKKTPIQKEEGILDFSKFKIFDAYCRSVHYYSVCNNYSLTRLRWLSFSVHQRTKKFFQYISNDLDKKLLFKIDAFGVKYFCRSVQYILDRPKFNLFFFFVHPQRKNFPNISDDLVQKKTPIQNWCILI